MIRGMVRGILDSITEGFIKLFSASGRTDESFDQREYFQHYGFTSHPLKGAEIIIIREGNHILGIASDDRRYRLSIADGEVALYDDLDQKVHLTRSGIEAESPTKITATAPEIDIVATTKVTMTTPLLEVSGNITAGGNITDSVRSTAADRIIYNAHTHPNGGMPSGQE